MLLHACLALGLGCSGFKFQAQKAADKAHIGAEFCLMTRYISLRDTSRNFLGYFGKILKKNDEITRFNYWLLKMEIFTGTGK